jgi:lysyl-tRNA synthetase class 2
MVITYQGHTVDLTPGKWKRIAFREALQSIGGHSPDLYMDFERLSAHLEARGEKTLEGEPLGKLQAKLFDLDVERHLIAPHFIYHYPTDISPLARRNDEDPTITDRFELFITGREFANGFSELNDPMDQRSSFEAQMLEKVAGDDEAHSMDEDYLRALEYGMPPAGGEGIGIDRLVMLMTDAASIREVILFPLLKAE